MLRIWLHEGHDGGPGVEALGLDTPGLDCLGFRTWAASRDDVVAKVPGRFGEYAAWRARHGLPVSDAAPEVEIAGQLRGDEILFPPDREPATPEEVDLTLALLAASRADLVRELEAAPEAALDWDPPYASFAAWADWRTIRANLAHVANGEVHYYASNVGHEPDGPPAAADGDWREFLPRKRAETVAFLTGLRGSRDRSRTTRRDWGRGSEDWSVRKALRSMVGHELLHAKSIRRILHEYARQRSGGRR